MAAFAQKMMDAVLSNVFKNSSLRVDLASNDAAAGSGSDMLVVLSSENVDQIRELASGESGLPFFQQRVQLDRMLKESTGQPVPLNKIVRQLQSVLEEYQRASLASLEQRAQLGTNASLEYLSAPRNSYVMRMKNEAYAAIRTAFDSLVCEAENVESIHRSKFKAWDCIEGSDRLLTDQFAQLCAYTLSNSRIYNSGSSIYISEGVARRNVIMLRMALAKTVARLREHVNKAQKT